MKLSSQAVGAAVVAPVAPLVRWRWEAKEQCRAENHQHIFTSMLAFE